MTVSIRPATSADIPLMEAISSRAHLDPFYDTLIPAAQRSEFVRFYSPSPERQQRFERKILRRIASDDYFVLVAETEGHIVGFTFAKHTGTQLDLRGLFVDPDYQGKHIGTKLFEASLAPARPGDTIQLSVLAGNTRAINMYRKYGFVTVREDTPFFGAPQVVMQRTND